MSMKNAQFIIGRSNASVKSSQYLNKKQGVFFKKSQAHIFSRIKFNKNEIYLDFY